LCRTGTLGADSRNIEMAFEPPYSFLVIPNCNG